MDTLKIIMIRTDNGRGNRNNIFILKFIIWRIIIESLLTKKV